MPTGANRLRFTSRGAAVVAALLVLLLGAGTIYANAQDRSVSGPNAPQDASGVDQSSTTTDVIISGTANLTLLTAVVGLGTTHGHGCVVTATADVLRTADSPGIYAFGISLDSTTTTAEASDRTVQFLATPDLDVTRVAVATTMGFDSLTGTHTFRLMGRSTGTATEVTVTASSLIVVCAKVQL
ncbi:hypothetical protein BH20ACT24_BH20ACT24_10320 [soil metagenome]